MSKTARDVMDEVQFPELLPRVFVAQAIKFATETEQDRVATIAYTVTELDRYIDRLREIRHAMVEAI